MDHAYPSNGPFGHSVIRHGKAVMMEQKAAIYCRLSEEDRNKRSDTEDSNSIRNQKALLLQYAASRGWEVFNVYSDDDYAGSDRNRPEFKRLLADAEAHRFNIVLCKTQSRFTRELELVEKYIHGLFPIWGIRFIGVADNADTDNLGNKKSRQINGLVNEWYLEDMSESIRSVLNNRRENGLHIGSFALYGYQKDPDQKGHLLIDEEAAGIVREVFTLFSQGCGKTAIARILNDRGVPNPTEYKRLHGMRYRQRSNSTLWRYSAISSMLTNEIYLGNMVQGKYGSVSYKTRQNRPRPREQWYRVEGTHEAIIDRALWDSVQTLIQARAKPFAGGEIGLFAHKARCANCGCAMRSSKNRGRRYLQCSTRHLAKKACTGSFIAEDLLETMVLSELNQLSDAFLDKDELLRSIDLCGGEAAKKERLSSSVALYQKKRGEYGKAICNLYLDKTKGLLTEEAFSALSCELSAENARLERLLAQAQSELMALDGDAGENLLELVEHYTKPAHLTREMVDELIEHIAVGKREKGEKYPPVEIYWNF